MPSDSTSDKTTRTPSTLEGEIARLRERLEGFATEDSPLASGFRTIAEGLDALAEELGEEVGRGDARVEVLLRGLHGLADTLGALAGEPSEVEVNEGSSKFHEMFRKEARKRLSGLSISMMGIFGADAAHESIAQTSDHLHALKGSAAMLGLEAIQELVGAMEHVVKRNSRHEPAERQWPTRAMLQAFHLLESATKDPELRLDTEAAGAVMQSLGLAGMDTTTAPYPTMPPPRQMAHSRPNPAAEPDYEGPVEQRILVADDVEAIAASVGFVLAELEVPVDVAEDGREALEMLQSRPYSLVISDISMPRLDGLSLTRMIRQDPNLKDIPVILLTGLDRPGERDAGIEAGASDYVVKGSIGGGELASRVRELLAVAPRVPAQLSREMFSHRILIAEDTETVAASIAFILSDGDFDIDVARNGAEALERLRSEDFDLLVSDVQMPEMDGLALLSAIRSDAVLSGLPVVLLTSLEDPEVQQEALDIGVNRFLIKGKVGGDRLLRVVEDVLDVGD